MGWLWHVQDAWISEPEPEPRNEFGLVEVAPGVFRGAVVGGRVQHFDADGMPIRYQSE